MKQDPYLTPCSKIDSKWVKNLNVWPDAVKVSDENNGETLQDISASEDDRNTTN